MIKRFTLSLRPIQRVLTPFFVFTTLFTLPVFAHGPDFTEESLVGRAPSEAMIAAMIEAKWGKLEPPANPALYTSDHQDSCNAVQEYEALHQPSGKEVTCPT